MAAPKNALKKELTLLDVFCISTGAMFSSGFFLLPGIAAAQTGPSVVLAYLVASFLILPAMFSIAELSTAMPRAGGAYFFLDRSMGVQVGTISGMGLYWILVLKTAFALIGIGAYAAIVLDVPIRPVAVGLTVLFMLLNILGAKETAKLQRVFVLTLLGILALFVVQGLHEVHARGPVVLIEKRFTPFLTEGWQGLLSTVGLVFVSYIGLTKVASVAEEVQKPERNIPLGMFLSVIVTTLIYVVGVFIVVAMMEPAELHATLTPLTSTVRTFSEWMPASVSLWLIIVAAIAAFASTGNAGLLSASRYPLAMARDHILPQRFLALGRFRTPTFSIVLTSVLVILIILFVEEEAIAKLASAFQLFVFMLVSLAVIVMRESRLASYDPGFHAPFYPWLQAFGIISSLALIIMMGWMAIVFTMLVVLLGFVWYKVYVQSQTLREGAIYHWFAHLGARRYDELDIELRGILREKGLRDGDPFDEIVARALTVETTSDTRTFEGAIRELAPVVTERVGISEEEFLSEVLHETQIGATPVFHGVALPHLHLPGLTRPEMVLMRSQESLEVRLGGLHGHGERGAAIHAIILLLSPEDDPKQHLRILAQIAERVDGADFMERWLAAPNEMAVRETLLSGRLFFTLELQPGSASEAWIGKALKDIEMPEDATVVLIERGNHAIAPRDETVLEARDELTMIGDRYETVMALKKQRSGSD